MTRHTALASMRLFLDRGSRVPASLMMALLLGTTACPSDETPMTTGEDSTTGDDTTTTMTPVTVTLTDPTTVTPETDSATETVGVDSTDTSTDTTEGMTTGPTCGDDVAEGDEQCDGTDLGGQDCAGQGFTGGRLACADDCTFDTSACTSDPVCGNDVIDGKDVCDGTDLGGEDCVSQGFDAGTLACLGDCTGYDTARCTSESCEDEDIGGAIGPMVASGDTTMSDDDLAPSCGGTDGNDHVILFTAPLDGLYIFDTIGSEYDTKLALFSDCDDATELACNDDTFGVQSEVDLDMVAGQVVYVVIDGFDGEVGPWVLNITEPSVCGDGMVSGVEACDGAELGGATCQSAAGLPGGAIACAADCAAFDITGCNAPTGYANCATYPEADVCTINELCVSDGGTNAVCADLSCMNAGQCAAAPPTGNAPVTCADVTGDMVGDCYLSCELGETCPDGMTCVFDFICLWSA